MKGTAGYIARALRGYRRGAGYLCHCPVPSHGKGRGDQNPSLSVADGDKQLLVKCFAGCDPRDVLDCLRGAGLMDGGMRNERGCSGALPARSTVYSPDAAALALWDASLPIAGSQAARYLIGRGLTVALPKSLRCGAHTYAPGIILPVMVAAVQAPDGQVVAVQSTYLDATRPEKANVEHPRKTLGALGEGAVRLRAAGAQLGLAEGVESGLGAIQLTGVSTWASLGSTRMHRVKVPEEVKTLHIFADDDEAGHKAVERTAAVHHAAGRRVEVVLPPAGINDWAAFAAQNNKYAEAA